jgi:hypothetical protein
MGGESFRPRVVQETSRSGKNSAQSGPRPDNKGGSRVSKKGGLRMGLFSEFHQKRVVEDVDGFRANGSENGENIEEKGEKYFSVTRAQSTSSTNGAGEEHFNENSTQTVENVENPTLQTISTICSLPSACPADNAQVIDSVEDPTKVPRMSQGVGPSQPVGTLKNDDEVVI